MCETSMQELVGYKLKHVEVGSHKEMKTTPHLQRNAADVDEQRSQKHQHVDDEQIPCYYRYVTKHLIDMRLYN